MSFNPRIGGKPRSVLVPNIDPRRMACGHAGGLFVYRWQRQAEHAPHVDGWQCSRCWDGAGQPTRSACAKLEHGYYYTVYDNTGGSEPK